MKTLIFSMIAILLLTLTPIGSAHQADFIATHYMQRAFVPPIQYTKKDVRCLTQAIYYEANNQPPLGKEAVAVVVVNRFYSKKYPKSICHVVYQSSLVEGKKICQFSFTCAPIQKPTLKGWIEAKNIAERVLQNHYHHAILRELDSALYFHATYVRPEWSKRKVLVKQIGQHLFYKEAKTKESYL